MQLVWKCMKCKRPIADNEGSITISRTQAMKRLREDNMVRMGLNPKTCTEPKWEVLHFKCDSSVDSGEDCYWFDVERCRTREELTSWGRHLSEKTWFNPTNWWEITQWAKR